MASSEKKYGLIDPKAKKKLSVENVFNNDSDSDGEKGSKDWIKKKHQREAEKESKKLQTMIDMTRALKDDPTVYQYDEIYETMKKEVENSVAKVERKPKYMTALLKTAESRKKENDRRTQRLIQKEREAEGETFADKEEFITSAYRDKLEDLKKAEEEEKKMEYIESVMDVTKQKDLGGFYRHLFKETVAGEMATPAKENEENVKEEGEIESDSAVQAKEEPKQDSSTSDSSTSDSDTSSSSDTSHDSAQHTKKPNKSAVKLETKTTVTIVRREEEKEPCNKIEKSLEEKKEDSKEPVEKKAKFESSNSSRKERNYRQRESSTQREPSPGMHLRKSPNSREERSKPRKEDRERYRGTSRERERGRERDRERRDERRIGSSRDRHSDSRDSRRQRSRSRNRREPEKRLASNYDGKDRKQHEKVTRKGDEKKQGKDDEKKQGKDDEKKQGKYDEKKQGKNDEKKQGKDDEKKQGKDDEKKAARSEKCNDGKKIEKAVKADDVKPVVNEKKIVNIWEKRTIGSVFEAALERYYQRKANRGV